jgi:PEP-CTERM motif-containing protein
MRKTSTLILLLGALIAVSPVFGAVVIDFGTGDAGIGGLFTLTGGGNATGANIPIDAVTISGAPLNDGTFEVTGTGADAADANGSGVLNFNTATNTVSIIGGIPLLGIANGTTLLTGSFTSFSVSVNGIQNATGPDQKSAALLTALGVPIGTPFGFFGFSITTNGMSPDSVISTDFRNTSVPEPSSIVLFGSVLFGCCALLRRRFYSPLR